MTEALLDFDFNVHKCAARNEVDTDFGNDVIVVQSNFRELMRDVEREIAQVKNDLGMFNIEVKLFFSCSPNFRKKIDPEYKGARKRKKPAGYRRCINKLKEKYSTVEMPTLEADDALGIYATRNPGCIIVSPDKDLRQIPGLLYDYKETVTITPEEGAKWHLIQTLAGDPTDGYAGCPSYGIRRAAALLDEKGYSWKTVVEAFESKDLTEEDALRNARLARILTKDDYDDETGVKLWTPDASYRVDDGATVQAEAA